MQRLLKQPNVLKLFISYLITHTGTAMAPIAMAFGVLDLTGSAHDTAYVMAAATLASVLVLLLGGAIADRFSRKKVILYAELFSALTQGVIAYLFLTQQATVFSLVILMFLNGVAMAFNAPATSGIVPLIVDKKDLQSVNAVLGLARNGAMVGGAALAGILVALVGAGYTILIDAISFAISALLIATLTPKKQLIEKGHSIIYDLKVGWKAFIANRWLWAIVLQFSFVLAAFEAIIVLVGPAVALEHYTGPEAWGWVMSSIGVGLILGGLISLRLRPKYPLRFASFCVFASAIIPLCIAFTLPIQWFMLLAVISGITWELFGVIWVSTLQKKIPQEVLSRVSAYDYLGSIGLAPLGIVVAGYFYDQVGYQIVSLVCAGLIIVATGLVLMVKEVWQTEID